MKGEKLFQEVARTVARRRHVLEARAAEDVVLRDGAGRAWEATGNNPCLELVSSRGTLPTGWVWLYVPLRREEAGDESPVLFVSGPHGAETVRLPPPREGLTRALVRLPEQVTSLRLGVASRPLRFTLEPPLAWEVGQSEATLRLALPLMTRMAAEPERVERAARKWWGIWREEGRAGLARALKDKSRGERPVESYDDWIQQYDRLDDTDRTAIRRRLEGLAHQPLISVVMPTYQTPEPLLRLALDSVLRQLYSHWELCIADDASPSPHVRAVLEEYARKDPRIRYTVRERNGHISAASNSAIDLVRGEFIALLDHDDELSEHALYHVIEELNAHPEADILYSDEDKLEPGGRRFSPYFKPDWNLELFRSQNLISHLGVYRTSLVREVGGFREGLEGSQDYDLALRVMERVPASHIRHIPWVLYHWRAVPGSTALNLGEKDYAGRAARRALEEHYARVAGGAIRYVPSVNTALHGSVYPVPEPRPRVSLLLSARQGGARLRQCGEQLQRIEPALSLELLLAEDGPGETLSRAARINRAAARARGEVLVLLDEGLESLTPRWLEELVAHAMREDVGVVGARLFAPDRTLRHAGLVLGLGADAVAGSLYQGQPEEHEGLVGRALLPQEVSAVSASCLATRRSVFEQVGGLDAEHLPGVYFGVDYCLRVRERGHRVVWNPAARLYQHDALPEEDARETSRPLEVAYMKQHWESRLREDPFYNPNLTRERGDNGLAWPSRARRPWRT